jgi:hypothetical protein
MTALLLLLAVILLANIAFKMRRPLNTHEKRVNRSFALFIGIPLGLFILLIVLVSAKAEEQTRVYDSRGNSIGTAAPQGQGSVRYYDRRGNSLGTSTTNSTGTTTFYGSRGNVTGSTITPRR